MAYEVVDSSLVYKGKVLDVYKDRVMMPNGNVATRENIVRGSAVAMVPIDDDGNIYFVRQYRHAAKKLVLEIPAGMIEKGEEPEKAAYRELEEEVGTYAAIGICTERVILYIAQNLTEGTLNPDPDEFIEIEKYSIKEAVDMIFNGQIEDIKTVAGILAAYKYTEKEK